MVKQTVYFLSCNHYKEARTSVYAITTERALERAEKHLRETLGTVAIISADEASRLLERSSERYGAGCYLESDSGAWNSNSDKIINANTLYLNLMRKLHCNASLSPVALKRVVTERPKLSIAV